MIINNNYMIDYLTLNLKILLHFSILLELNYLNFTVLTMLIEFLIRCEYKFILIRRVVVSKY